MNSLEIFGFLPKSKGHIPLFTMSVAAGIPVPVDNSVDSYIDLNDFLVDHPSSTFFAKVNGNMMDEVGIKDGDILIIDTSIEPTDGKVIIVTLNNDLTIKYYRKINGQEYIESQEGKFFPLSIGDEIKYNIIGVVTKIIHSI